MDEMMRAVRAHRRDQPNDVRVETVPVPAVSPDEVLIAVHAASITFAELGWDETWEHAPAIPAHEFSGVVVDRGDDVRDIELGEPVYGLIRFERQGAAAEYVTVPAADVALKPASLTHAEAAAVPLAALTAWQGLFDLARVQAGDRVLVHGGAGGVGAFAVQLAKNVGATVVTTVRGADAVAFSLQLGADEVVDTESSDFAESGRAYDVVFDTIGGGYLDRSYDVLVPRGRLVTLQAPPDADRAAAAEVEAHFFIVSPDVGELAELADLADRGLLRVTLAATFPLEDARAAFESGSLSGRRPGKTVLIVRGE
ncbi:NADP-dependent oxidoreductase [Leifsonia sp. 2MCAF36]|uniref:NADP-dependent oxidoreductase n=1 Tax=Leifsonia sp. 2MCAF36 TaxID=3232988 RepID=UPI003F9E2A23